MHGPDYGNKEYDKNVPCDIEKDKKNLSGQVSVEHKECKGFQSKDYWEYKHHTSETHKIECKGCEFNLYGPATTMKTYVIYPCNKNKT